MRNLQKTRGYKIAVEFPKRDYLTAFGLVVL